MMKSMQKGLALHKLTFFALKNEKRYFKNKTQICDLYLIYSKIEESLY